MYQPLTEEPSDLAAFVLVASRPAVFAAATTATTSVSPVVRPFAADEDDHCETPAAAYADVAPALHALACQAGKTATTLRIYDPYFCDGAVVRNLNKLGFTNVYNRCEDFYRAVSAGTTPAFDVLVTNPPYSGDHMEKLFHFATECGKPWLILVPNYVATTAWYPAVVGERALFVAPSKRYQYVSPTGARSGLVGGGCGSGGSKKAANTTAPYVTLWFIGAGSAGAATAAAATGAILPALQRRHRSRSEGQGQAAGEHAAVVVSSCYAELPSAFKAVSERSPLKHRPL